MAGSGSRELNPYRVLGLSTRATSRDIRRRFDELKVRIDLGIDADLTEDALRSARQALDDPSLRVRYQWFWLLAEPPLVGPGIDFDDLKAVKLAVATLDAKGKGTGPTAILARHDAAVVRLEAFRSHPLAPINLERLFTVFNAAVHSDSLWDLISSIGESDQDPRTRSEIKSFRSLATEQLLNEVISRLSLVTLPDERLREVISAIQTSGAPRDRVNAAISTLTEPVTNELTAAINRFEKDWHTLDYDRDSEPTPQQRATLERLQHITNTALLPQARRLNSLSTIGPVAKSTDQVANCLVALSIAVLDWLKDGWRSLALADAAVFIAFSPKLRTEIQERRLETVARVFELGLVQSLAANDWPLALAYIEMIHSSHLPSEYPQLLQLAATIQRERSPSSSSVEEAKSYIRRKIEQPDLPIYRPGSKRGPGESITRNVGVPDPAEKARRRIIPWVVGVSVAAIVLVTIVDGNDTARPSSRAVRPTSVVRPTSPPSCEKLLEDYQSNIDALEPQINNVQSTMTAVTAAVAPHATEIAWIETNYPSMVLPADLYDRYQYVVSEYNIRVDQLERLDINENRKLATYNRYVDQYNELLPEC